jgi:hypothetical protein
VLIIGSVLIDNPPALVIRAGIFYMTEMSAESDQLNEQIAASVALLRRHL